MLCECMSMGRKQLEPKNISLGAMGRNVGFMNKLSISQTTFISLLNDYLFLQVTKCCHYWGQS